jgi:hypothetical protein
MQHAIMLTTDYKITLFEKTKENQQKLKLLHPQPP